MKGRIGVFEIVKITDTMKKIVETGELKGDILWEEFYRQGAITMREDGVIKVLKGVTTMEEVERATADTVKDKTMAPAKEDEQIV
jgi:type II secretory ATPase GspE/PulE/Tfp pilus assembly ATPase PilB-like protein